MYLFSKVRDLSVLTDDFHFYFTPIDCRKPSEFFKFIGSTVLLGLMTLSPRKIVYYSSESVTEEDNMYSLFKRLHEKLLRKSDLILRIPRVYSSDRDKGLIKVLRDKTYHGSKAFFLDYITDEDWREFYIRNFDKEGVVTYDDKYRHNTVQEIEDIFINGTYALEPSDILCK